MSYNVNTLENLPRDVVIEIFNKLSITQIKNIISSSRILYHKYYPYIDQRVIQDEMQKALEAIDKRLNLEHKISLNLINLNHYMDRPILLSSNLTNAMNLEHMPYIYVNHQKRTVYTFRLALMWWALYICSNRLVNKPFYKPFFRNPQYQEIFNFENMFSHVEISSNFSIMDSIDIYPDEFMINTFNIPKIHSKRRQYYHIFELIRENIDQNTPLPVNEEILANINEEYFELFDHLKYCIDTFNLNH